MTDARKAHAGRRAVVLTHAPFEGPGIIADVLEARGHVVEILALHAGEGVPEGLPREDLLVVMGGSMGVADVGSAGYPFLADELRLLERRIVEDAPVLGVCLGAQLLAAAAGASVRPIVGKDGSRVYEVGWAPVRFFPDGPADRVFTGVPGEAPVLHWHGDAFELPREGRKLASSAVCDNQGFQLGARLFGLQFHCEVTRAEVDAFTEGDGPFIERANGAGSIQKLRADTETHLAAAVRVGRRLIENIVDVMAAEPA